MSKKKVNKTNPIGVRFNLEILELIKEREKLATPQKVLNWLMEEYKNRCGIVTEGK